MGEAAKGRRPRPPSEQSAQRLRKLYERRQQTGDAALRANEELVLAVLDCCEREGASYRQVALVLDVGKTTVGNWVREAKQLRGR